MADDATRTVLTGPAVPVRGHDIDTDRIIPARFLRCVVFDGLGAHAFEDDRAQLRRRGETHPLDNPRHAGARILLVNRNFGCGSSREHAPQALARWGNGIQAIVGESFAEIFAGNCQAIGVPCVTADQADLEAMLQLAETTPDLPFVLDLPRLEVTAGDRRVRVAMPEGSRRQLIEGLWDSTWELLAARDQVRAKAATLEYFRGWQ